MVRGIFLLFVKYWDYPRSSGELKSLHTLPWYETSPSIRGTCYSGQECWVIPEGYSRLNGYVSVPVKHVASPYIWGYSCKFRNIRIIPDPPGTYSVDRKSTLSQDHPRSSGVQLTLPLPWLSGTSSMVRGPLKFSINKWTIPINAI